MHPPISVRNAKVAFNLMNLTTTTLSLQSPASPLVPYIRASYSCQLRWCPPKCTPPHSVIYQHCVFLHKSTRFPNFSLLHQTRFCTLARLRQTTPQTSKQFVHHTVWPYGLSLSSTLTCTTSPPHCNCQLMLQVISPNNRAVFSDSL